MNTALRMQSAAGSDTERLRLIGEATGVLLSLLDGVVPRNYAPTLDRVLLLPLADPPKSRTLLVVSEQKEESMRGLLIRMGAHATRRGELEYFANSRMHTTTARPGAHVIFARHSGQAVVFGEVTFRLVKSADILAVLATP